MATQRLLPAARDGLLSLVQGAPAPDQTVMPVQASVPNQPVNTGFIGGAPYGGQEQPVQGGQIPWYEMKSGGGKSVEQDTPWYKDPNLYNQLALGFNSMRLNPDQGLAQVIGSRIKRAGEMKAATESKNKTVDALRKMGMDEGELALLSENPDLLKIAATAMYKQRTGGDITADLQTFSAMTEGMSPEDRELARRIKLGLAPRATSVQRVDLGTSWGLMSGDVLVGTLPKDLAGVEAAKAQGQATGEAQVQYPQIVDRLNESISVIDRTLKMPNFEDAFGVIASRTPTMVQGTKDVEISIEQIQKGQFLAAIDQLRGLGALSNSEGAAATAAQTNLNLAMSPAAARDELARLKKIMETGKQRALNKTIVDPDFVPQYIKDYEAQKGGSGSNAVIINGTKITPVNGG